MHRPNLLVCRMRPVLKPLCGLGSSNLLLNRNRDFVEHMELLLGNSVHLPAAELSAAQIQLQFETRFPGDVCAVHTASCAFLTTFKMNGSFRMLRKGLEMSWVTVYMTERRHLPRAGTGTAIAQFKTARTD